MENRMVTFTRRTNSDRLFWKLLLASAIIHFLYIGLKEINLPVSMVTSTASKPIKLKIIR